MPRFDKVVAALLTLLVSVSAGPGPAVSAQGNPTFQVDLPVVFNRSVGEPATLLAEGYVRDGGTGVGLANATVYLEALTTGNWVRTDSSGHYRIMVPPDKYDAIVSNYPESPPYTYTQR